MMKYEPNTDNDTRTTTEVPLVKTQTRTVTYLADGSVVEEDPGMLVSAQAHSSRTCTTETTTVSHHAPKVHLSKRHQFSKIHHQSSNFSGEDLRLSVSKQLVP